MSKVLICVDQSISNSGFNIFEDDELILFGNFGSKSGTKKDDKGYILTYSQFFMVKEDREILTLAETSDKVHKDETDIFQRVKHSTETFKNLLDLIIQEAEEFHVVFEGLSYGSVGSATRDIAGLLFNIISSSLDFGKYSLVAPTSAKKAFTGDGRATKLDVINNLPKEIKQLYIDAGYKYSEKTGNGDMNDLADSYSFYKWYKDKQSEEL